MGRESSGTRTGDGKDPAGRRTWHRPVLTTIEIQQAELNAGRSVDGPYGPSS